MKSTTTPFLFHRQISTHLFIVFLMVVLSIALVFSLYSQREKQLSQIVNGPLSELQKQQNSQQNLAVYLPLFDRIMSSKTSEGLQRNHLKINENLQSLAKENINFKGQLNQLLAESKSITINVIRASSRSLRNEQLKESSQIQLQLVVDSLRIELSDKSEKLAELYQQIINDKVKDSVTINRAKTHADLAQYLNVLRKIEGKLLAVLVDFKMLDIHIQPSTFENISKNAESALAMWSSVSKKIDEKNHRVLTEQLFTLEALLFKEQKAFVKWRDYIRLSQAYFVHLNKQRQQLESLFTPSKKKAVQLSGNIPKVITTLLAKANLRVNYQQYNLGVISLLFLFISILLFSLLSLRYSIKRYGMSIRENKLTDEENIKEEDESHLQVDIIEQAETSLHSEAKYQQLVELQKAQAQFLAEQNNVYYWQYKLDNLNLSQQQLLVNLIDPDNKFSDSKRWRSWFDNDNVRLILAAAKQAKAKSLTELSAESSTEFSSECNIESVVVKNKSGHSFCIHLLVEQGLFTGSIINVDQQKQLEQEVALLGKSLVQASTDQQVVSIENSNKLAQMITRTMLQSQSVSIGSGVTSIQVYRQLTRIFDWCRQYKIKAQLQMLNKPLCLANVSFIDELHASIFNVMAEAQLQRNSVFLACDESLLSHAKLDVRLFNRTIVGLCRLLLLEQYKSTLLIEAQAIDIYAGQQLIQFTFSVQINNARSSLPALLKSFVENTQENHQQPEVISYLKALLLAQNGREIQAKLNDNGFQLTLEIPITITEKNDEHNQLIDLNEQNILLIPAGEISQKVITTYAKQANANIYVLDQPTQINTQLRVENLSRHKLDIVIIAADYSPDQLANINSHIDTLPKKLQPKIMVMQAAYNSALHKQGLYGQANSPLCQQSFIESLKKLINSEERSNRLLSVEAMAKQQFMPSQVELLLAVEHPQQHQTLIRILHWLGIQVQVVCQESAMTKYWQSGRYLLLVTELSASPFVEMSVGRSINRAIFTLNNKVQKSLTKRVNNHIWQVVLLASYLQFDELISQLKPWLKEKLALTIKPSLIKKAKQNDDDKKKETAKLALKDTIESKGSDVIAGAPKGESKHLSALELTPHESGNVNVCFDMKKYASNQGSAELAAFMIDEYLADIHQFMLDIESALTAKDFVRAEQSNIAMLKVLKILSAGDFILLSLNFEQALKAADNKKIVTLYQQLQQQQQAIISFAEAI